MNILSFEYLFPLYNTPRTFFVMSQCSFKLAFFNLTMKIICQCWPNDLEFSKIILNLFKIKMLPWSETTNEQNFLHTKEIRNTLQKTGVLTDLSKLVSHDCT